MNSILKHVIRIISQTTETQQSATLIIGLAICYCLTVKRLNDRDDDSTASGTQDLTTVVDSSIITNSETIHSKHDNNLPSTSNYTAPTINQSELRNVQTNLNDENEDEANVSQPLINNDGEPNSRLSKLIAIKTLVDELIAEETQALNSNTRIKKTNDNSSGRYCKSFFADRQAPCEIFLPNQSTVTNKLNASDNEIINFSHPSVVKTEINEKLIDHIDNSTISVNPEINEKLCDQRTFESWNTSPIVEFRPTIKHRVIDEPYAPINNFVTDRKKKSVFFTDNFVPSSYQQNPFEAFARRQLTTERDEQLQLVTLNESNDTTPPKHNIYCESFAQTRNLVTNNKFVKKSINFTDNFVPLSSSCQQSPFEAFARRQLATERDEQLQLVTSNESNDTSPLKHKTYSESFAPIWNLETNNKFVNKSVNFTDKFEPFHQQNPFEALSNGKLATKRNVATLELIDASPLTHNIYSESVAPIRNSTTDNKFVKKSVQFSDKPLSTIHQQSAIEPLPNRELATRKEYLPNSHQSLNYLLDRNQKRQIPSLSKIKKFNESLSPISTKNFTDNSAYKRNDLNVEDFKLSNSQHCKYIQNSTKLTDEYQSNSSENVHKIHNVPRVTSFLVGNSENSYYPGSRSYLDKIIESDEILRENPISKEITDLSCSLNGTNQRKQEINHRITKKNSNFSNNFPKQSFDHLDGLENIDKTEQFVPNIADNRKITNNLRSFSQNSNNLSNKQYIPSINENNDIFAKQSTLDSQYDEADTVTRSVPKVTVNSSKITQNSSNLCDQQYDSKQLIEKSEKYSLDEQKHLAKIIEFDEEQRKDYCKNYFLKIKSKNSTEFFDNRTIGLKTNIHKSKTICLQQSFDKTVIDCSNLPKTSKTNEAKSQEPIISFIEHNFKDSQNDHHTEFITCYNVKKDTEPVSTVVSTLPPKHRYKALRTFLNKMLNKSKTKIHCAKCTKKCSGEVLRVTDKYFHKTCFQCTTCSKSLAAGGFFSKDNAYYCTADYQKLYGTKCASCNLYVEGEVVSTMGNTYHQKCFTCSRCKLPFQSGSKVTNTGKEVLCEKCVVIPINKIQQSSPSHNNHHSNHHNNHQQPQQQQQNSPVKEIARSPTRATAQQHNQNDSQNRKTASTTADYDPNECAGCGEQLKEGQALIALDRQWHIWCFRCKNCSAVLNGEYMGKDGVPYCEKCYQKSFGVKCAYCNRFISGKVLQAGDNHHFHPTCARCTKCGDPFGDGEEMYLQGSAIWHPRCGPGPSAELGGGTILNGSSVSGGGGGVIVSGGGIGAASNGHLTDTDCDRLSNSAMSEIQFSLRSRTPSINGSIYSPYSSRKISQGYRTVSPGLVLREYGRQGYGYDDISRIYTYSYLTDEPHYLRKPIDPYDKTPVSPHFHRPSGFGGGGGGGGGGSRPSSRPHSRNKSAMKVLVDSIRTETPRPKSPAMNNEEPIELSHYPGAKKPPLGEKPKIERDDFPAPPYPYTDPERRRRYSDSYKGVPVSDDEDEVDDATAKNGETKNEQLLRKEEEELLKINSGMGAVILKDIKEHAKYRKWKQQHMDPRNASRTPSASKEPVYRLRYESPVGASPSRHLDHQKPFYEDEQFDRSTSYRGSVGRSIGNAPSYNAIHSYRSPPKPGYGLKTSTLPIGYRNGYSSDFSFGGLGDKTHSTEFSCGKSDVSVDSITEGDRQALMADLPASSTYSGVLSYHYPQAGLIRRSLPNMAHSMLVHEPAKIYPYHLLLITNYRLPADVDRCNLERHLSDVEFEAILQCTRSEFYRMPQWRRNEIKRRARLF